MAILFCCIKKALCHLLKTTVYCGLSLHGPDYTSLDICGFRTWLIVGVSSCISDYVMSGYAGD